MPKITEVWNWFEIQEDLCVRMNIDPEYFRKYHNLVGGEYKDFWHVALEILIPERMANDSVFKLYWLDITEDDDTYSNGNEWKKQFVDAWNSFYDEHCPSDTGIWVEFSW